MLQLAAITKLTTRFPSQLARLTTLVTALNSNMHLELQQRSSEYEKVLENDQLRYVSYYSNQKIRYLSQNWSPRTNAANAKAHSARGRRTNEQRDRALRPIDDARCQRRSSRCGRFSGNHGACQTIGDERPARTHGRHGLDDSGTDIDQYRWRWERNERSVQSPRHEQCADHGTAATTVVASGRWIGRFAGWCGELRERWEMNKMVV